MKNNLSAPLDAIGFYQVTEKRARASLGAPRLTCGDLLLTSRCNYHCRYCNGLHLPEAETETPLAVARDCLSAWLDDGLKFVRFSGGEPTLYRGLRECVRMCQAGGVERIALSTNGSLPLRAYEQLLRDGVSELAVSLDAARPAVADCLAGCPGQWQRTVANLRALAPQTYVVVNIVLTTENAGEVVDTIRFAHGLGVADMKLMTDTHCSRLPAGLAELEPELLARHPILRFRVTNFLAGRDVRGLAAGDSPRCHLVKDDITVAGQWHFPCAFYCREGGLPIGPVGPEMRAQRQAWSIEHDALEDPICRRYCPDFMAAYNNRCEALAKSGVALALTTPKLVCAVPVAG
jgi:hypothetical protein